MLIQCSLVTNKGRVLLVNIGSDKGSLTHGTMPLIQVSMRNVVFQPIRSQETHTSPLPRNVIDIDLKTAFINHFFHDITITFPSNQ